MLVRELFPRLSSPDQRLALRVEDEELTYRSLAGAAQSYLQTLSSWGVQAGDRVGVWVDSAVGTAVCILGNLAAGVATIPLNPKLGQTELEHVLADARPKLVVSREGAPRRLVRPGVPSVAFSSSSAVGALPAIPVDETAAMILYTSGTTGAPKGVPISTANIAFGLDALSQTWLWTELDTVVHALPLVHVHGLVLGLLGSLRVGGALDYVPRFSADALAHAMTRPKHQQTVVFAVPTMVRRLGESAQTDDSVREALRRPRLLVSGSAGLPVREHDRIQRLTGRGVHERYGLTETLINCGLPAGSPPAPGYVGPPLPGVEVRLVDERRRTLKASDDKTMGEVAVRSDAVFDGYLNRPDASAKVLDRQGWFYTGDLATRRSDGFYRILGRQSTDLIKTGGYRVGAGEIEACVLEHPAVAECAVIGAPDEDLGERIEAFIVLRPGIPTLAADDVAQWVADRLAPHKRPRRVLFRDALPRNTMGKVEKKRLS